MREKILVLKGGSKYDVLRVAADQVAEGFAEYSPYVVEVVDLTEDDALDKLLTKVKEKNKFIFSIQAVLFETVLTDGTFLFSKANCPVIGWIADHPMLHARRVDHVSRSNLFLACIDKSHEVYMKKYYSNESRIEFLPHGGFRSGKKIDFTEKSIDIFMPGSYENPEKYYQEEIAKLPEVFKKLADHTIQNIQNNFYLTYEKAAEEYLNSVSFSYETDEFVIIMNEIMPKVDIYVRNDIRGRIIRKLLEAGYHVSVAGSGWSEFDEKESNFFHILSDDMDIQEVVAHIGKSKILLNIANSLAHGSHERVFTAMLNHTVCLSTESTYFESRFAHREEIVYFDANNLQTLVDEAGYILNNPDEAIRIAEKAYQATRGRDEWKNRAKDILEFARKMRDNIPMKKTEESELEVREIVNMVEQSQWGTMSAEYVSEWMKDVHQAVYWNSSPRHLKDLVKRFEKPLETREEYDFYLAEWLQKIRQAIGEREDANTEIDRKFLKYMDFVRFSTEEEMISVVTKNVKDIWEHEKNAYQEIRHFYFYTGDMFGGLDFEKNDLSVIYQRCKVLRKYREDFIKFYERLKDYRSKRVLLGILMNWFDYDIHNLIDIRERQFESYFDTDILGTEVEGIFVDVGAYDGDSAEAFIKNYPKYQKVIAYEVTDVSYRKCEERLKSYRNIDIRKKGLGESNKTLFLKKIGLDQSRNQLSETGTGEAIELVTLDQDVQEPVGYIKMDIEGAEQQAILGAKKIIAEQKPKLAICIYHGNRDIIEIPNLIQSIRPDYDYYLRYYGDGYGPIELVLYAV